MLPKFVFITLVIGVNAFIPDELLTYDTANIPSKEDAASIARTLVHRESLMNVNTIQNVNDEHDFTPVSAMEYYADCDGDGDPYWLIVDIGSTFQNIQNGSPYSFTIRMGDHPVNDYVNPNYPGGISSSPSGSPRVNLKGQIKEVKTKNPTELMQIERCFLDRHPDSKWWLPSNVLSPHKTHWVKIHVTDIYMVGGFGDRAYIGNIDTQTYHTSDLLD